TERSAHEPLLEEIRRPRPGVQWRPRSAVLQSPGVSGALHPPPLSDSRTGARRAQGLPRAAEPVPRARACTGLARAVRRAARRRVLHSRSLDADALRSRRRAARADA